MPGRLQKLLEVEVELEVATSDESPPTEADIIAYALELCPPGESIELHEAYCDVIPCACIPRVIPKPLAS